MSYVNVGAFVDGRRPASKRALREALASVPGSVMFDQTSAFNRTDGYHGDALDRTLGQTQLSVCGPDPYSNRRWYATVKLGTGGKVTVS